MVARSSFSIGSQTKAHAPRSISQRLNAALFLHPSDTQSKGFAIFEDEIGGWFGIEGAAKKKWLGATRDAMRSYKQLAVLFDRSQLPHVTADEAAIAMIYHEEMKKAGKSQSQ